MTDNSIKAPKEMTKSQAISILQLAANRLNAQKKHRPQNEGDKRPRPPQRLPPRLHRPGAHHDSRRA
jgi:hypothetical protein